jgi:dihydropyrimidinase
MTPFSLTNDRLHHNVDCEVPVLQLEIVADTFQDTPYEGMSFTNWPRYTILRGKVVWAEGQLLGTPQDGETSQLTTAAVRSIADDKRRVATWLYK